MIETIAFKTQARTVDHLGREQIADCPTAISELWKNAYDAYARAVSLHIFDDPEPVAAIFDDGHGMNYEEFVNRWLIIGTQSKFDASNDDEADRDGLPKRTKQGQKGIGRLSSANLGPLLLLVSKRKGHKFVAALIDWRIFENPFLVLSDIEVPVTQFEVQDELADLLPELFDRLTDNIWGNEKDPEKTKRLKFAWDMFDRVTLEGDSETAKPSDMIAETIINARFDTRHLEPWSVWSGERDHGTALVVSDINYDLRAQLPSVEDDGAVERIRAGFFATLSAFTDPYVDEAQNETNAFDPEFSYEVKTWAKEVSKTIIEDDREAINRSVTDDMEHVLSGNIDADGVFRGQVKAFGEWRKLGTDYEIYPPKDYIPPKGPTTFVGPIGLHIATYEVTRSNSTHSDDAHAIIYNLAQQHSGFLIFRNGLRVLPYGRVENDFFEIEARRSLSAGREFWNARRMFGRIALSRELNPNLRDKAGREGFIDNRSAKALRTLVANIIQRVAYEYFGSVSDLRKKLLPDIQEGNLAARAEAERKELSKRNAVKFRKRLKDNLPKVSELYESTRSRVSELKIETETDLERVQLLINQVNEKLSYLRLTGAPAKLGSAEDDYRTFRHAFSETQELAKKLTTVQAEAIERIKPARPEEIAERQLNSLASRLQSRLRSWRKPINTIQTSELQRVEELFGEKNKEFHKLTMPFVDQVKLGRLGLESALEKMADIHQRLDTENEDIFQSYLDTLELMSENVNIELIARQGTADNSALRDDLNSLNRVAQLGITVEILGHELNANERMIREGLRQVKAAGTTSGTQLIETGFEALSNQLEFLSPLKVSGNRTRKTVTGLEISKYLKKFFEIALQSRDVVIDATDEFNRFQVEEQPSRLFPVFVNLVNNSIYWLVNSHTENPTIKLSIYDGKVIVSDNGPGIDQLDQESLFKMFFTRKVSGGRGIGLYLCRVNLLAGGHSIEYVTKQTPESLSGATFLIDFKGANFD
jgi:C4-dicarboxylate-specific signal transduction histidine kinase